MPKAIKAKLQHEGIYNTYKGTHGTSDQLATQDNYYISLPAKGERPT